MMNRARFIVIRHSRPFPFPTTSTSPERLAGFVILPLRFALTLRNHNSRPQED
jgi:hypothetical protein